MIQKVERDGVAAVLHRCLENNLLDDLPNGCEAGYMLADALTAAGMSVVWPSVAARVDRYVSDAQPTPANVPIGPEVDG